MTDEPEEGAIDRVSHALGLDKSNPPPLRDDQENSVDRMGHFLHLDREAEPG